MSVDTTRLRPDQLLGASLWRITFLLVQGGGSVILAAALAHILDAHAFATTSLAQGVLVIAQTVGDFGLSQAAVTILPARAAAAPASAAALFSGAAHAYLYASAAALLLTLASTFLVPSQAVVAIAVSAPAAAATVLVAGSDGLLRAQGRFRRPVLLVAASELGGFAGIPVAIATHSAIWTCVAVAAGTGIGSGWALVVLCSHLRRPAATREFVRAASPLGLAQVFVILGARVDTLLAASIPGVIAAGTFEGTWRIYQLGQYAAGALATAAAPFVASALGVGDLPQTLTLLRRLVVRLLGVGLVAGAVLYFARWPLAHLLAGSLAHQVAGGLVFLAVVTPLAAVGIPAYYTLIAIAGELPVVVGCFALGATVNLGVGIALARSLGTHGILIGCAAGTALTSTLLLWRLAVTVRALARQIAAPAATPPIGRAG